MRGRCTHNPKVVLVLAASSLLSACFDRSDAGPQLLVPDEMSLHWDVAFDGREDQFVALVPVDVMVYDGESGEAMAGVDLLFSAAVGGSALILPEEVAPLDDDFEEAYLDTTGTESAPEETSARVWDAWRDRYFDRTSAEPREALALSTDDSGLARVYAWVDTFPSGPEGYEPIPFVVAMGGPISLIDETFLVVAR